MATVTNSISRSAAKNKYFMCNTPANAPVTEQLE